MNKYKVSIEWWESRIYRCETTFEVKAENEEDAEQIAEGIRSGEANNTIEHPREWTQEEQDNYSERLKDTDEEEVLNLHVEEV